MKLDDAIEIMKGSDCPSCGKHLDACSGVEAGGRSPSPGDITICLYCGHVMAFSDTLGLRDLTDDERRETAHDSRLLAIQKARKEMKS
jgi:hypothetical protein